MIEFVDLPYLRRDGVELLARVYRSSGAPPGAPAVVDVHGGAWSMGDRTFGVLYDEALAARGFVVVAIDFRQAPAFSHPAASDDVSAAVRWVRESGATVGADPDRIGVVGSSSGGHLALLAACQPGPSASVGCVAALWAPVDPHGRYRFALEQLASGPSGLRPLYRALADSSLSYFGSEAAMAAASPARIVAAGEAVELPPLWICHPTADTNVPFFMVEELRDAWAAAGGRVRLSLYADQPHAFGHTAGPRTGDFIDELESFLRSELDGGGGQASS